MKIAGLARADVVRFVGSASGWSVGVLLPKAANAKLRTGGFVAGRLTRQQLISLQETLQENYKLYLPSQVRMLATRTAAAQFTGFPKSKQGFEMTLLFSAQKSAQRGSLTVVAESRGRVIGGNTFVLIP